MKIVCINHIIEVNEGPQNYSNLFQLVSASQHILLCQNKMLVFTNIFLVVSSMYLTWDIYRKRKRRQRHLQWFIISIFYLFYYYYYYLWLDLPNMRRIYLEKNLDQPGTWSTQIIIVFFSIVRIPNWEGQRNQFITLLSLGSNFQGTMSNKV